MEGEIGPQLHRGAWDQIISRASSLKTRQNKHKLKTKLPEELRSYCRGGGTSIRKVYAAEEGHSQDKVRNTSPPIPSVANQQSRRQTRCPGRRLQAVRHAFCTLLLEIGSKLKQGFLSVSSKHKFLGANMPPWDVQSVVFCLPPGKCLQASLVRGGSTEKRKHTEAGSCPATPAPEPRKGGQPRRSLPVTPEQPSSTWGCHTVCPSVYIMV